MPSSRLDRYIRKAEVSPFSPSPTSIGGGSGFSSDHAIDPSRKFHYHYFKCVAGDTNRRTTFDSESKLRKSPDTEQLSGDTEAKEKAKWWSSGFTSALTNLNLQGDQPTGASRPRRLSNIVELELLLGVESEIEAEVGLEITGLHQPRVRTPDSPSPPPCPFVLCPETDNGVGQETNIEEDADDDSELREEDACNFNEQSEDPETPHKESIITLRQYLTD